MAELDDSTEVRVRDEVMTLGEYKARLAKLAETETPFEREQRLFDDAVWCAQKYASLTGHGQHWLDRFIIEEWSEIIYDANNGKPTPRLGKPYKTPEGQWMLVPIAH